MPQEWVGGLKQSADKSTVGTQKKPTCLLGCPWKLVSWLITYLADLQPTYIAVIIHLLSTMDIPVEVFYMVNNLVFRWGEETLIFPMGLLGAHGMSFFTLEVLGPPCL